MFSHGEQEINTQFNRVPKRLLIAIIVVFLESALIWGLTFWSLFAVFSGDFLNIASALFLSGILFAMALWTTNIALGLFRLQKWSHTAGLVLQLIFAAVATASFSGQFAQPLVGAVLLLLSSSCFVALFGGGIRDLFHRAS
ncbi:MAG: hypothetical protein RL537_611 [Actinomycetota bacterium]|jgi:hypothetical protein